MFHRFPSHTTIHSTHITKQKKIKKPEEYANGRMWPRGSPEAMKAGTPLCGTGKDKWFGMLFIIRGDLDWYQKTLKLANYRSNDPCCLCQVNATTRPWRDFRPLALWISSTWTTRSWRVQNPHPECVLFRDPLVSILHINPDWMHTCHLGI